MRESRASIGRRAEDVAVRYLADNGLRVVCRNFRRRQGEIDIVAEDGETVVFVEVRSHSTGDFGSPAESIGSRKLRKLAMVASEYLEETGRDDVAVRFDAVEVYFGWGRLQRINHIQNILEPW